MIYFYNLLFTIFMYLAFPVAFSVVYGKVEKEKAKIYSLVNSIVVAVIFAIIRLVLTDGELFYISFPVAVFYYFINVLILRKNENGNVNLGTKNNLTNQSNNPIEHNSNLPNVNCNKNSFSNSQFGNDAWGNILLNRISPNNNRFNIETLLDMYKQSLTKIAKLENNEIVYFSNVEILTLYVDIQSANESLPLDKLKIFNRRVDMFFNNEDNYILNPYNLNTFATTIIYLRGYFQNEKLGIKIDFNGKVYEEKEDDDVEIKYEE